MNLFKNIFATITGSKSGSITINGKSYSGTNVQINGNSIIIDGIVQGEDSSKIINISIEGNVDAVSTTSGKIYVAGNAQRITATSGDININNNVSGDVMTTSGDVTIAGSVSGNIKTTSGDVDCGNIGGSVSTVSGDIIR